MVVTTPLSKQYRLLIGYASSMTHQSATALQCAILVQGSQQCSPGSLVIGEVQRSLMIMQRASALGGTRLHSRAQLPSCSWLTPGARSAIRGAHWFCCERQECISPNG